MNRLILVALSPLALASLAGADPIETRGVIAEVTVYRGQALVTRSVPVKAAAGIAELLVTDLPERIVPESLFAESSPGLTVRSVSYRVRPVSGDVRDEVRKLDDQIRAADDRLAANQRHTELAAEHKQYLAKLEGFVAPTATAELTKGVLDAATLKTLTQFIHDERSALAEEELKLATERRDAQEHKTLLERQKSTVAGSSSRTVREAVVLLDVEKDAAATKSLRLGYLVDQATWSPSYIARASAGSQSVALEYDAAVEQMSGEDWSNVAMTLSTASPSLVARAPQLAALTVALTAPQPAGPTASYADAKRSLAIQQKEVDALRARNAPAAQTDRASDGEQHAAFALDKGLNELANNLQVLDLTSRDRILRSKDEGRRGETGAAAPEESISVSYTLPAAATLPSRSDRQQIQIASLSLPAEFYKVAVPVLTTHVYDEAGVTNSSTLVLLAGPVSSYIDARFVGKGQIPTVAAGETFTAGFGIDSSLRAGRELVEKTESIQGGNRVVELTYALSVENFGPANTPIRLLERMPKARDGEIRVTLVDPGQPLSPADPEAFKKQGILRWDTSAPGQQPGKPEPLRLEYKLRLEHDKQMTVSGLTGV
jgi:hypothetical protein